ncbi:hypothetical protein [Solimicrobium silvestre]|uniref:Uncharacterized protein n=1 Tax=Solimicrobium silvestre TaxID=2099400 RepID=A0A2S9GWN2_9BURK|nr:hypothetical protein [Solimicrobium silvestre]PRC92124.1 hypothetical protein S2091_3259 [Solimicrobium silvestre]
MAAKMKFSFNLLGAPITLDDAKFAPKQDYRCEKCTATVLYNAGSNPERFGRSVKVEHYFKLKKGFTHEDLCKFNILGQVKIIAKESDKNFIKQLKDGQYELRLLLPSEGNSSNQVNAARKENDHDNDTKNSATTSYVSSGNLNSYLNTAAAVLKLRAFCEEHSEVENHLTLRFDTISVHWKDFYFEIDHYKRLYRILSKATVIYPIAVSGKVKEIKKLESKTKLGTFFWKIDLDVPFEKPDENGTVKKTQVSISTSESRLIDQIKGNEDIVIFGKWRAEKVNSQPNQNKESKVKTWENLPLKFNLTHQRQIIKL